MPVNEAAIAQAIQDLQSGVHTSLRAAAQAYGVKRSTLQDRVKGTTSIRASHQHQQRLTPLQEEFLVEWILEEAQRGYAPSHARAREMACRILRSNGDTIQLGKRWIEGFKQRNPRVATVIGRRIEAARIDGTSQ
jgi:hypothetical protein